MKSFAKIVFIFILGLPIVGQADHSWGGYHWARQTYPFTLIVEDNLTTSVWKNLLLLAAGAEKGDWNYPSNFPHPVTGETLSTPVKLSVVQGTSKKNCPMVSGTTQVCNGGYGKNGWLGLATISITGGVYITQGSAKMNDSYFTMKQYDNPNERQHVVCQEIAHTFGLGHQSETGVSLNTCMDYFSNTGAYEKDQRSIHPNFHDFEELNIIYGGVTEAFSTYLGSSLSPVLAMGPEPVDHNDPNSWGQMVSQTRDGRGSIYERITGPKSKTITHVYWANEALGSCPSCDHRYQRFE